MNSTSVSQGRSYAYFWKAYILHRKRKKAIYRCKKLYISFFFFQLILVKEIIVKEVTTYAEITEVRVA